jgi:hypothetical protein
MWHSPSRESDENSRRRSKTPFAILAIVCTGCSSAPASQSSPATTCMATTACGGDVAGTWAVDSECVAIDSPFAEPECQNAVRKSNVSVAGTVTYTPSANDPNAGTQQVSLTYSIDIDEDYSAACLKAIGLGGPSAQACAGLQAYWTGPYAETCSPQQDSCECTFTDQSKIDQSDSYTIENQQLVLASSGPTDFCRSGDTLVEGSTTSSATSTLRMHLMGR